MVLLYKNCERLGPDGAMLLSDVVQRIEGVTMRERRPISDQLNFLPTGTLCRLLFPIRVETPLSKFRVPLYALRIGAPLL